MFSSIQFIFKQSFKLSKKSLYLLFVCLCLKYFVTFFGNAIPIIASKILKSASSSDQIKFLLPLLIFYWPLKKLRLIINKVSLIFISPVISELFKNISKKYFENILQMPLQKIEKIGGAKLSGYFNQCQSSVSVIFYDSLFLIPLEFFDGISVLFLTAYFCGFKYFFISLLANFIKIWVLIFRKKSYQQKKTDLNLKNSQTTNFLNHTIYSLDFIKSNVPLKKIINQFNDVLSQREICETRFHQELEIANLFQTCLSLIVLIVSGVFVYFDIFYKNISPTDLVIIFPYLSKSLYPAANILNLIKNVQAANRLFEPILKIIRAQKENLNFKCQSNDFIKIENLSFSYNDNKSVFEKKNYEFETGLNCVVGKNGSGKTTLLKIVAGLYRPKLGQVKLPAKNKDIVYLTQKIGLSNDGSVGQCRQKQLKSVLEKRKKIYILDEPTENLDCYKADFVLKKIEKLAKNSILIVATHDKRIICKSNKIVSL